MRIRTAFVAIVAPALLASACASSSSRISSHRAEYDSYPPDIQKRISDGQVDVGFTAEQVRLAIGEPDRKFANTTENGSTEIWAYTESSPSFGFGVGTGFGFGGGHGGGGIGSLGVGTSTNDGEQDKLRLTFVEGHVVSVEQALK